MRELDVHGRPLHVRVRSAQRERGARHGRARILGRQSAHDDRQQCHRGASDRGALRPPCHRSQLCRGAAKSTSANDRRHDGGDDNHRERPMRQRGERRVAELHGQCAKETLAQPQRDGERGAAQHATASAHPIFCSATPRGDDERDEREEQDRREVPVRHLDDEIGPIQGREE